MLVKDFVASVEEAVMGELQKRKGNVRSWYAYQMSKLLDGELRKLEEVRAFEEEKRVDVRVFSAVNGGYAQFDIDQRLSLQAPRFSHGDKGSR